MLQPDVYIGTIVDYANGRPSAIAKRQVSGSVMLTALGLEGDEQAETRHHGGPDRALCHYPQEHYLFWQQHYPQQAELFCAPAMGENLSTRGMSEETVYIGDVFRWGEALVQVTQPRSPCFKLNAHLGIERFSVQMQDSGRCGWLYRVLAEGMTGRGRSFELVSRNSDVSVAEAIAIAFQMPFDAEEYRRLMSAAGLSASWCRTMQQRLLNGRIEEMNRRLLGA